MIHISQQSLDQSSYTLQLNTTTLATLGITSPKDTLTRDNTDTTRYYSDTPIHPYRKPSTKLRNIITLEAPPDFIPTFSGTQYRSTFSETQGGRQRIMARLFSFTVIDKDPALLERKPEFSIVLRGQTRMTRATDDKTLMLELGPEIAQALEKHNEVRVTVEYEDREGRTRTLKPAVISELDIVVTVIKTY